MNSPLKRIRVVHLSDKLPNKTTIFLVAGCAHLFATVSVYLIGVSRLFPNWIQPQGVLREDPTRYLKRCELLSQELSYGNYDFLVTSAEQIHIRLYAISHFLQADFVGSNILAFELVNLPLFLAAVYLVFKIASALFEPKTGFISGYAIVFFPSFILHSTQPLRDLLFSVIFLFFIYQILILVKRPLDVVGLAGSSAAAVVTFLALWFVRDSMLPVYLGILGLANTLSLIKNFKNEWKFRLNTLSLGLLLAFSLLTPVLLSGYLPLKRESLPEQQKEIDQYVESQSRHEYPRYLKLVNGIRHKSSVIYADAGSNIDAGYTFQTTSDLIAYLPKAIAIGLFAPFPSSWLGEGVEYGKTGRIVSGIETSIAYLIMTLSLFTISTNRNISVLFITSTILIGVAALGLVTINVGAIYRLRYVFWLLIIILGSKGASIVLAKWQNRRTLTRAI